MRNRRRPLVNKTWRFLNLVHEGHGDMEVSVFLDWNRTPSRQLIVESPAGLPSIYPNVTPLPVIPREKLTVDSASTPYPCLDGIDGAVAATMAVGSTSRFITGRS